MEGVPKPEKPTESFFFKPQPENPPFSYKLRLCTMFRAAIVSIAVVIATSICFLLFSGTQKSIYHTLYLSSSFSSNESISNHLYTLTKRPHVAGSAANAEAAAYVMSTLKSYNIRAYIRPYYTALTYPVRRSITLAPTIHDAPIELDLKQEIYEGDPYADVAGEVTPTFHAFAKSGTAVGLAVYVNYGRVEDYSALRETGVNVSGRVALARYGKIYRGDIVQNGYAAGAIGVIIFTDRKDFGGGGGDAKWFPDEKWMPPTGVQVGSVYSGAGDPTTPGWASTEGCERITDEEVEKSGDVPLIPSLPVSWKSGEVVMKSIGGMVANEDWQGGEGAPVYRLGPGPGVLNLTYEGKQVITTIENVIGIIEGVEEPDRYVILGNHRDAWTFGAADPNSGTACLLEVAERLQKLQKKGWKPRRTIMLCNWDAEEYGLIGSTEWVEENRQMLASRVVAYLNVDVAVSGAGFEASSTPQLDELIIQAAKQVGRLGGGGSDHAAFVQHIGYPVYHSMYDDFTWMKKFGDPLFQRHTAVANLWGLVALKLADEEILPFNYLFYALELQKSVEDLQGDISGTDITLAPLFNSIAELKKAAIEINNKKKVYAPSKYDDYGSRSFPGIDDAIEKAKSLNTADSWHSVQHQIWRVARAITQATLCLKGEIK
ncbi:putative glutamate carboxypeptidase 2-like [Dorcoceras hygrometricum]|uniref:Putative glutamate carboxypeptidase 2-like n=1 Tax=Dorcoceras hygrometricum TaxID=472368 RepID=A0A2Z7CNR0_9LAMI|nr:putative glutamate carboxypeptidase 2-like [Dorcoceras hygrometricum]